MNLFIRRDRLRQGTFLFLSFVAVWIFSTFTVFQVSALAMTDDIKERLSTQSISAQSGSTGVTASENKGVIANAWWANVRSGAGTEFSVISTLPRGTKLDILGDEGRWYKVRLQNGQEGYIAKWIIEASCTYSPPRKATVIPRAGVNFRTGPGTNYPRLFALPQGTEVEVLGETNGWYKVRYRGQEGYMAGWLLNLSGSSSSPGAAPGKNPGASPLPPGATAEKIVAEANRQLGTTRYQNSITEYGNLACAAYVSGVLKECGVLDRIIYNTTGVNQALRQRGWKEVPLSQIRPGDVIFWGPYPGGIHGHVGIIAEQRGGTWYTCDNSSTARVPVKRPLNYNRKIICVLRAPA